MTAPVATATEDRALSLLGSGVQPEQVAAALGVSASRISQLLSQEAFAEQVAVLRYENLQAHSRRDGEYDSLEDTLLDKLRKSLPLMFKPETILKAIQVVNNAKRRGQSAPDQVSAAQNIVQLILPIQITQKFATNINNQVVKAGDQELHTMPANILLDKTKKKAKEVKTLEAQTPEINNPGTYNGNLQTASEDTS